MQWCVIGRGEQWGQRRRRWRGPRDEASWPLSSHARLALLSPPEEIGYLHTQRHMLKITDLMLWLLYLTATSKTKQRTDLTAGHHAWPDWREQHLPRSWLCWLLTGSDRAAKLDLQLLFGPLLLAPPPLFPPSSPSLHPLLSCWPPETQTDSTGKWKDRNRVKGWN